MTSKPRILALFPLSPIADQILSEPFDLLHLDTAADPARLLAEVGPAIQVILTGSKGVPEDYWAALPALKLVVVHGVGVDKINLATARQRGIQIRTTPPERLSGDVADLAIGLWIALCRNIARGDQFVRAGGWEKRQAFALGRRITGQRIGIAGLGHIGSAIAERARGFTAAIAYSGRGRKDDVPYAYAASLPELAQMSDVLFVAITGGAGTKGLIGREVFDALGPDGLLVNISRGSILDEKALIAALAEKRLGGAALDVFLNEPQIDGAFAGLPNLVMTPHQGSATGAARRDMALAMRDQIAEFFAQN